MTCDPCFVPVAEKITFWPSYGFTIYWNGNDSPLACFRLENNSPIDSGKLHEFHGAMFLQPSSIHKTQVTLLFLLILTVTLLIGRLVVRLYFAINSHYFSCKPLFSDTNLKAFAFHCIQAITERWNLKRYFIAFKLQQKAHATS